MATQTDLFKRAKSRTIPNKRLVNWDSDIPAALEEEPSDPLNHIFFYPNRPILIPPDPVNMANPKPDYINSLEASKLYIAEKKYNGDNCYYYPNTNQFWNRHKSVHRYQPPEEVMVELKALPKNAHYNLELCNYKTTQTKNLLVVHCLMVWKGQPLIGKTWGDSRKILEDIIPPTNQHVILSPIYTTGFWDLFNQADGKEIEGIILKNPKGKLVFSTTPINDVSWMKKIRKPCKKYRF
jgi:hypothetical protein